MKHRSPLFSDPTTLNRKSLSFPHPTPTTANGLFIITSFAKGVHEGSTPKMYDRLDTVQFMFKAHEIQNECSSSLGGSPGTYHLYLAPSSSTCGSQSCLACRPSDQWTKEECRIIELGRCSWAGSGSATRITADLIRLHGCAYLQRCLARAQGQSRMGLVNS